MSEFQERRRDAGDLRYAIDTLNGTVGELKGAVGELKITVGNMRERDMEDRMTAKLTSDTVNDLLIWRSRIRGQLALIYFLILALGATVVARIFHLSP